MAYNMEQGWTPREGGDPQRRYPEIVKAVPLSLPVNEDTERIRPDVMAFIMQAAQASHLARLRRLEEAKIPTGEISRGLTVSGRITLLVAEPLISFTLINDGPNSVYVEINNDTRPNRAAPILINESYNYDAIYPVITSLTLDVNDGDSAAIRIRGKAGNPMDLPIAQTTNPFLAPPSALA